MLLNQVCYRTLHLPDAAALHAYESIGGYKVWRKILTEKPSVTGFIHAIKDSGLRGRGGAGFPVWQKWDMVAQSRAAQKYIICNSEEGEPGTFKDRDILTYNPHQIIEGMAIAGYVLGATVGYNYIRSDYAVASTVMATAIDQAKKAGLLGENIKNSGVNFQLYCCVSPSGYISGEETALLECMEGRCAQPRVKPPYPTSVGLYGCPTLINNTETLASIPVILEHGSQWYAGLGVNGAMGCKIFSVSGKVNKPGNYEVPLGMPFAELLELAGGMAGGKQLKAVIPGGISTAILPADLIMHTVMDYNAFSKAGSSLGTGGVIVMDEDTCMVSELAKIVQFYLQESCGKCTPCREGIGWVAKILNRLAAKQGRANDVTVLEEVIAKISTNSLCALGDSVPIVVSGFLKHFKAEFESCLI